MIDLLIYECQLMLEVGRLQVMPGRITLISAIVKQYVPATMDERDAEISQWSSPPTIFLREVHWFGIFQKMMRDHGDHAALGRQHARESTDYLCSYAPTEIRDKA